MWSLIFDFHLSFKWIFSLIKTIRWGRGVHWSVVVNCPRSPLIKTGRTWYTCSWKISESDHIHQKPNINVMWSNHRCWSLIFDFHLSFKWIFCLIKTMLEIVIVINLCNLNTCDLITWHLCWVFGVYDHFQKFFSYMYIMAYQS
jgi:hypothetical protein